MNKPFDPRAFAPAVAAPSADPAHAEAVAGETDAAAPAGATARADVAPAEARRDGAATERAPAEAAAEAPADRETGGGTPSADARADRRAAAARPRTEADDTAFLGRIVLVVVFMLALISGAWTYEGALLTHQRVDGETMRAMVAAGLLAIAVTAGVMTAWTVMMTVIPRLATRRAVVLGIVLLAVLQVWTLSVSSLNNLISQIGPATVVADLEEKIADAERTTAAVFRRAAAAKPLVATLEAEAAARCRQAESEIERGGMTGSAGRGAVSGTLEGLCEQTRTTAANFAAAIARTEEGQRGARDTITAMKDALHDHSMTVFEREAAVIRLGSRLQSQLSEMKADDLTDVLRLAHEALVASLAAPTATVAGSFGDVQTGVIQGLRASVNETAAVYEEMANDLAAIPAPELEPMKRAALTELALRNATDHLPLAAAAFGIDFFQLFMVLAFAISRADGRFGRAAAAGERGGAA